MASGAQLAVQPTADPSMGVPPMPTTSSMRRATSHGLSPSAKRSKRREIVTGLGPPPETSHTQLVQEVHRMHAQWTKDSMFLEDAHEAINDHSDCLKLLTAHIVGIKSDFERLTKEAADNDKQLKENLKTFESTVTAQDADSCFLLKINNGC